MAPRKRARAADGTFRSSGGSVTGGTGDIKPQQLTVQLPEVLTADYGVVEVPTPRVILSFTGAATVMEILKVWWYVGIEDFLDPNRTAAAYLSFRQIRATGETINLGTLANDMDSPTIFAAVILSSTAIGASGVGTNTYPMTIDMTDNNGNGFLIATDKFFATHGTIAGTLPVKATVKILYRMVNITLAEYVGIVQSQV